MKFITPKHLKKIEDWLNRWLFLGFGFLTLFTVVFVLCWVNWANAISFIQRWETLTGALVGAFIPIMVVILWNPVRNKIDKYYDLKTSLREIQIDSTLIINDIVELQTIYSDFLNNIRVQVAFAKDSGNIGPLLFNPPPKIYIYENPALSKLKTGSPFLHNSLIGLSKWGRQTNAVLENIIECTNDIQQSFKDRFQSMPTPLNHDLFNEIRNNYHTELLRFVEQLENPLLKTFKNGLEAAVIVRICGDKLNNWNSSFVYSTLLKHFDVDYKKFCSAESDIDNKSIANLYANVQPLIQEDVDKMIAQTRSAE